MSLECSSGYDFIEHFENRSAELECRIYDAMERIAIVEGKVDETAVTCIRQWDHQAHLDEIRCEIIDFKQQLIDALVKEIAKTFKQEYCIDYGPADEQEFLQNIQYLYT